MMMYTQDYDEHYPPAWWGAPGAGWPIPAGLRVTTFNANVSGYLTNAPRAFWMDLIYPYIKSTQVFNCPSSQHLSDQTQASYGYNLAISNFDYKNTFGGLDFGGPLTSSASSAIPISLAQVQRPSEVIMVGDFNSTYFLLYGPANFRQWAVSTTTEEYLRVSPHLDGTNVIFADGHAKWRNAKSILGEMATSGSCGIASGVYCSPEWNPFLP